MHNVIDRLSIWSKQLTLQWYQDSVLTGDLENATMAAGWRDPIDKIAAAMGMVAELFVFGLVTNYESDRAQNEVGLILQDICEGLTVGESREVEGKTFFSDFPFPGHVLDLCPTALGSEVAEFVDGDLGSVYLEDQTNSIRDSFPDPSPDMVDFFRPGAVGRAAMEFTDTGILTPSDFFQAVHKFGFEDSRDQAVFGFGTLAHMLTIGALIAGTMKDNAFEPDNRGVAEVYQDLAEWWFNEAPALEYNTWVYSHPRTPPSPTPKNTAFRTSVVGVSS